MSIKVHGGTVSSSGESLCFSCKMAHHHTNVNGVSTVYCHSLFYLVNEKIVKCSSYEDKSKPSRHDFEMLAWTLQTDKNRGPIGFKPPDRRGPYESL